MNETYKQKRLKYSTQAEEDFLITKGVKESATSVEYVTTKDGWELAVSEYHTQESVTQKTPIFLCHGLGNSRLTFDLLPEISLANYFASRGYAVFSVDLRGHGLSEKPTSDTPHGQRKTFDWGFADYLEGDLTVAIEHVCNKTGADGVHYVGHSMGGILLYSYAGLNLPGIKSGVAVGSSMDYTHGPSGFKPLIKLLPLIKVIKRVPFRMLARATSRINKINPKWGNPMFLNIENTEPTLYRLLLETSTYPFARKVLQEMSRAITGKGLLSREGVNMKEALLEGEYPFPILGIGGDADVQNCEASITAFGTDNLMFGIKRGHKGDYGHFDLLCGRHAKEEVYPHILEWVQRHD